MSAPASSETVPAAAASVVAPAADTVKETAQQESGEEEEDAKVERTDEERAKKAAAKKKRKQERAKRKKAEAAASSSSSSASAAAPSAASPVVDPAGAAAASAALDALESSFPSNPMHSYFTDANSTKLLFTRERGRHVVAAKPIPAGEAVFRMPAYAAVVNDAYVHAFCSRCFQTGKQMYCCSRCQHARFCSTRCRDAQANVHNLECAALGRLKAMPMESESAMLRMIIRICFLHQQEKLAEKQQQAKDGKAASSSSSSATAKPVWLPKPGCSFAAAQSLVSHSASYPTEVKSQWLMILSDLQQRVIQDEEVWRCEELDVRKLMELVLRIQLNAHDITEPSHKARIGLGLFIPAAYLNHSCRPNCVYWYDAEGHMVMQSIRPISVNEEISYSYIDLYASREERALNLNRIYMIADCMCARCQKTHEKATEDALMRSMICSACSPNPLLAFKRACDQSASAAEVPSWKVLKVEKGASGNMYCSEQKCGKVYKKAVLDELIQNTRRLADQAALIAQSGDYSDAVELLEERILYQEKPDSQQQPWMHPYHAALFRIYLQLQQTLAAMQTTSQSAPVLIQDLQYTTAILECLDAQLLGGHPEAADFLYHKGELFRTLQTMQHGGASVRVREVPRLVPQSNGGSKNGELNMDSLSLEENNSAAATSSAVSSSSSPCSSVPSFYKLISSAYLNFARACEIRITARGKAHELTRQAGQCADGLQAAYEKEAGQGLYSKDFDNDEATAAAGKSKAKEKGGKR